MDNLLLVVGEIQRTLSALGIGVVVGLASGILGIGGAPILVPAMVFLLGVGQKAAQGASLAVIVPTAVAGAVTHYRLGNVAPRVTVWLLPSAIVGAVVGAAAATRIDAGALRQGFALLLLALSVRMFLTSQPARRSR